MKNLIERNMDGLEKGSLNPIHTVEDLFAQQFYGIEEFLTVFEGSSKPLHSEKVEINPVSVGRLKRWRGEMCVVRVMT